MNGIDTIVRIYVPDFEPYNTWSPPQAERIK